MFDYGTGDNLYWDNVHGEVRFTASNSRRTLLCRVSSDALAEHCDGLRDPDAYVTAAKLKFRHICHRISDKLSLGLTEPDGSVLVRDKDW
jgi:hypothetical protein